MIAELVDAFLPAAGATDRPLLESATLSGGLADCPQCGRLLAT